MDGSAARAGMQVGAEQTRVRADAALTRSVGSDIPDVDRPQVVLQCRHDRNRGAMSEYTIKPLDPDTWVAFAHPVARHT